jgi:hypothetical protein
MKCLIMIPIVWQVNDLERSMGITTDTDNNDGNNTNRMYTATS